LRQREGKTALRREKQRERGGRPSKGLERTEGPIFYRGGLDNRVLYTIVKDQKIFEGGSAGGGGIRDWAIIGNLEEEDQTFPRLQKVKRRLKTLGPFAVVKGERKSSERSSDRVFQTT